MDRRQFVNFLIGTPLVDHVFNDLSALYDGGIRGLIQEGALKLGLKWSRDDIDALAEEAKQVILEKIRKLKREYDKGNITEEEFNSKAADIIESVQTTMVEFLLQWKDSQIGYLRNLSCTEAGKRHYEDKLRRQQDGGVRDRHLVTQKHLTRLGNLLKTFSGSNRSEDEDFEDFEDFEDEF